MLRKYGKFSRSDLQKQILTASRIQPLLEELPAELRIQILFNVDELDSIKSLVFASPKYHQAYQIIRHDILIMHLQKSYDGLVDIQDAIAAIRSRGMYAIHPSNRERIIALLDARRRCDEIRKLNLSYSQTLPDKPANVDEIIQLLRLHNVAMFFHDDFCKNAECPQWKEPLLWRSETLPLQLSRTEKRRFIRAFYRLQMYANIFGNIEISLEEKSPKRENRWNGYNLDRSNFTFTNVDFWRLVMSPMAPWEVEELGCFWQYCFKRLAKSYNEIAESLLKGEARFKTRNIMEFPIHEQPPIQRYFYNVRDLGDHEISIRDGLVSMGPCFIKKVLREQDFITRRNLVFANSVGNDHVFPEIWEFYLREYDEGPLPLVYPADNFSFGTDFAGLNELLDSLPDHERPNLLFRQRWLENTNILDFPGVFEDMFSYAGRKKRWDWGYAFWDDERIIQWGLSDLG